MSYNTGLNYIPTFSGRIETKEFEVFFAKHAGTTYSARTLIFSPEASGEKLYRLRRGRVDLFRITPGGKRLVIRQIFPGEIFGIMGLLGQKTQGNYAETIEDSNIESATRNDILEILRQRPELSLRLLEVVGTRLRLLEERLIDIIYSPVRKKIAYFILTNADQISGLLTNISHEEIGDVIGAARQTVTEALNLMQNQGLISLKPKNIRIVERQGLEDILNS
jgi:CRP/FNR family transcriptional regulator, cyclic AMP receptor protein